jgi:hypothetical protein
MLVLLKWILADVHSPIVQHLETNRILGSEPCRRCGLLKIRLVGSVGIAGIGS